MVVAQDPSFGLKRRQFTTWLAAAVVAWPLRARAQRERILRVGILIPYAENDPESAPRVAALHQGLRQLGWTDGRNVRLEHRWSASDPASIPPLARELVDLRPDVILTDTTPVTAAVLRETRTTPVVFVQVADPIGSGFVVGFPRPGGNATGFNNMPHTIAGKWLELLMEIAPRTVRAMFLFNPPTAPYAQRMLEPFKAAARSIGVEGVELPVHEPSELETVIAALAREPDSGLVVLPSAFMAIHRDLVSALAVRYRLPAIYGFRFYAQSGGLISMGALPPMHIGKPRPISTGFFVGQSRPICRCRGRSSSS